MIYRVLLVIIALFTILNSNAQNHNTKHLISIEDFKALQNSDYALIDLRKPKDFEKGHIEGAINLWRTQIVDSNLVFGGYRISRDTLQSLFSRIGVTTNQKVIIYDAKGDVDAARLWWMLYTYGHKNVALLNGGLTEWELKKNDLSNDFIEPKATDFQFFEQESEDLVVSFEDMKLAVLDSNYTILDTRTLDEYTGETLKKGAFRKGRIPRSIFIDWAVNIDYDGNRKFKSVDDLMGIYNLNGIDKNQPIITYCQSGVRSAHTTFVLTQLLGFTNVKNYDGSWIEWSFNSELPIETGEVVIADIDVAEGCTKDDNSDCQKKFFILIGVIFALILIVNLYFRRKNKV